MAATILTPNGDPTLIAEFEAVVAQSSPSEEIRSAFTSALRALAAGSAVRIEPLCTYLTTSQAAELLNVSRTTMVKLLQDGKLTYEQPNVHRLVRLDEVLAYKQRRTASRRAIMADLTSGSAADGTYFVSADEADRALASVRTS